MASGSGAVSTAVQITVRYWASARAAAGCESESFTGHHVGEVLEAAAAAHTGLGKVLAVSTILMDGRPVAASLPLSEGATIEVLPPFAGG
ncbi:MAG: sulfur-carrier protein [Actinomycetota bacterium]|nr:sulfur-carrier protein [Actinomycetota bacterium]